jgi:hypothetical protein
MTQAARPRKTVTSTWTESSSRANDRDGVTFLTTPPATAAAQRGRGTVVIDQLRWDTE